MMFPSPSGLSLFLIDNRLYAIESEIVVSVPFGAFFISNVAHSNHSTMFKPFPSPSGLSLFLIIGLKIRIIQEVFLFPSPSGLSLFLIIRIFNPIQIQTCIVSVPFGAFFISNIFKYEHLYNVHIRFPSPSGLSLFLIRTEESEEHNMGLVSVPFGAFFISNKEPFKERKYRKCFRPLRGFLYF